MKDGTVNSIRSSYYVISMVCVTLFFLGCSSVSIQSVRDPSFSDPINKLFVIFHHGQVDNIDPSYTPLLIAALKDEFSQKSIETEIRAVSPLELDANVYLAEIASYKPDGVLTIVASGGVTNGTGGMLQIFYDVSLFDRTMRKRIWRAQIDASGDIVVGDKRMRLVARDLINRLIEEKLISSEPRKKEPSKYSL